MSFSKLPIGQLLRKEGFECRCGKHHAVDLDYLDISAGAIDRLPEVISLLSVKKPFIVCDKNTYEVAGKRAEELLRGCGTDFITFIFPQEHVIEPDELPVGQVVMAFEPCCDYIIAVGGGVVNDVCKILSKATGRHYIEICTAPSMDGIVSNSSSMVSNGIKSTIYTTTPKAIIADVEIMRHAPMLMLQSGLGDMVAKYISLFEWKISNIITGEYYCAEVAALMRAAVDKCVAGAEKLRDRDADAVATVTEGLILSGIAMSFARVSRPASGLEHYFSHMFDMFTLERGTPGSRHGIQVGIGTVITLRLYDMIKDEGMKPSREKALKAIEAFSAAEWESEIRRIFGKTGDAVLGLERKFKKNAKENHAARLALIIEKWDEITAMMESALPCEKEIAGLLESIGEPIAPIEIGITDDLVRDAFTGSREIRDKYILTSLLWDMGIMDEMCERLIATL